MHKSIDKKITLKASKVCVWFCGWSNKEIWDIYLSAFVKKLFGDWYIIYYLIKINLSLPQMSTILNICCLSSKYFQNSFSDIARVLSEFFRDLDVVPSDVVVGLVLLRQRQQLMRLRVIHQVHFFAVFPFFVFMESINVLNKN